ncbi:MAG: transporter family protein [Rhodocyclales bacterium]|nr:transporter family protein [Rhodocyclales bacterium]
MSIDTIVVSVKEVSKTYRLWRTPGDRLIYPLKRIANKLLPTRLRGSIDPESLGLRDFHALHDVSFEIHKGESWGFIGTNGSGKSTLLKIISGNLRPSSGTVEVDGKVAILDYGSGFNGDFTGRENIFLKGALLGLTRKQLEERFQAIAEFADIGDFIDQPVKTYSTGMGARLGFAIMAHVDADIMITDEALGVGDAFFVQKCMRHIRSFLERGTFLFVSHSTNDVMTLCDNAVWLDHGRVVRIGKASEVCRAYISSIDRRSSQDFLGESQTDELYVTETDNQSLAENRVEPIAARLGVPSRQISVSAAELAALKNHYAPFMALDRSPSLRLAQIEIKDPSSEAEDLINEDGAVGGGKIFSVTITDAQGGLVPSVLGGEIICLTIRAVAEKIIRRPIIGFQLKNNLGLTLIAENTFLVTQDKDIFLCAGEVITARFHFAMPLMPVGEYVVRVGFADGVEDNNALLDVRHDALLLRCETSGVRHGLVGVPMLGIDILRDDAPQLSGMSFEI